MKRSMFLFTLAACVVSPVWADAAYPNKPIRIIVPFTPGGSPDVLARTIGQKITEATGAPVVIDNVPGAGGTIGQTALPRCRTRFPGLGWSKRWGWSCVYSLLRQGRVEGRLQTGGVQREPACANVLVGA